MFFKLQGLLNSVNVKQAFSTLCVQSGNRRTHTQYTPASPKNQEKPHWTKDRRFLPAPTWGNAIATFILELEKTGHNPMWWDEAERMALSTPWVLEIHFEQGTMDQSNGKAALTAFASVHAQDTRVKANSYEKLFISNTKQLATQ